MQKNILLILPFFPWPLRGGGHQALFNGIAAIHNDMNVSIVYEAINDKAYRDAENTFLAKIPNVTLYPILKEPNTRCYNILQRICERIKQALDRICYSNYDSIDSKEEMIRWWRSSITPSSRLWIERISDICKHNDFDIIQVEMPWRISDVFMLPTNVKKVHVHHELGFVRRELEISQLSECLTYAETCRKFVDLNEISQLNLYDAIITLSSVDSQKLIDNGINKQIHTSFAIVDSLALDNVVLGDGKRLTFVGPEIQYPNLVGVKWFLENCWTKLRSIDSSITLDIIGIWSGEQKNEWSEKYDGVNFLGFVADLNSVIRGSTMIVPITIGSGIRMKILEASSRGVPFVSTTIGAEGLPFINGKDSFITDDPNVFVQNIIQLQDKDLRQQFITNSYNIVKNKFSLESLRTNRLEIYKKILESE